jgi:ADP-dependent phosphofructokinase/glucokinase
MKVICAYPVNVDALHNLNGSELAGLCSGSRPEFKDCICSLDDFCSSLLHCMREGSGGELLVESPEVARVIDATFSWQYRLGGNAGIMANVLATLGASPVLNAPSLSERLAKMLDPRVKIPVAGGLAKPVQAAAGGCVGEDMIHFVLQFSRGVSVKTGAGEIIAPSDNRFIASFDPQNSKMASTPDFDSYCQREIRSFDGALVSGFHLAEFSRYREIFQSRIEQIRSWKDEHPDLYIHAEMGSFQRPEMMKYLLSVLPVDSVGMNEDELAMLKRPAPSGGWKGIHDTVMNIKDE